MRVWIAREIFDYEGSTILAVRSTEPKALQACEDKWVKHSETKLIWKDGRAQGYNHDHYFEVDSYEVDKD